MDPKLDDYTSRKFVLALLAMGLSSTAFFLGKLPFQWWLGFLTLLVFGYGALNIVEAFLPVKPAEVKT
jgi:hypothetical protein